MNESPTSNQRPFARIVQSHVDPEDYSVEWGDSSVGMYGLSEARMWAAHMNEAYAAGRASEPSSSALTFAEFRKANVKRCLKWHPAGVASWSPSDWLTAVTGELGELASLLKMRNRERDGLTGNKFSPTDKQVADELADVLTYLDLLAEVLGVDLAKAAVEKFNEVSARVGFPDRLPETKSAGDCTAGKPAGSQESVAVQSPSVETSESHTLDYGAFGGEPDEYAR